jgi:hypothetical protein
MQRAMTALCVSGLLLTSELAVAVEPAPPSMLRQQINDCMSRKMGADKALSYNEAMRACKARLQPSKDTLASNGAAPPAPKSH